MSVPAFFGTFPGQIKLHHVHTFLSVLEIVDAIYQTGQPRRTTSVFRCH